MAEEETADSGMGWIVAAVAVVAVFAVVVFGVGKPFDPAYLNLDYLFGRVFDIVRSVSDFFESGAGTTIKVVIAGICTLLFGFSIFLIIRLFEMENEHEDHVYHKTDHLGNENPNLYGSSIANPDLAGAESALEEMPDTARPGQAKWETVLDHISSQNSSDWRMAIIEADTILDTLLEGQGYPGATLGERLRNAGEGAFRTFEDAGVAHGVRNQIAHEGADFQLSYRDAKNTISRYENVFREFEYI